MSRSFPEKLELARTLIFDLGDDDFEMQLAMITIAKGSVLRGIRAVLNAYLQEKNLVRIGSGVEAAVFGDISNEQVVKFFWPTDIRPVKKYDQLTKDTELVEKQIGDIAVPTDTTRVGLGSRFSLVCQTQPWIRSGVQLPESPNDASNQVITDLEILLRGSQNLQETHGKWIDIFPPNYRIVNDGIAFFDMSLFDPRSRGEGPTRLSLEMHSALSEYVDVVA